MGWYSLRLDGMVYDRTTERRVNLLLGGQSLEEVLARLLNRVGEAVDATSGKMPSGLQAALTAQLSLAQWDSWSAFRQAEAALQRVHPAMTTLEVVARVSGNYSRGPRSPRTSGDSPPT